MTWTNTAHGRPVGQLGWRVPPVAAIVTIAAGIASAEAFGTPTISVGGVTIGSTSIASAEAFGAATITRGTVTVAPTGIATVEAFGTPTITATYPIVGAGIASAEAFGAPYVTTQIGYLSDTFDTLNGAIWYTSGGAAVVANEVQLPAVATYSRLATNNWYSIKNSFMFAKITQLPNQPDNAFDMTWVMPATEGGTNQFVFEWWAPDGLLYTAEAVDGVYNWDAGTATTDKYWRIREFGGTVYWETSADGVTWTVRRSKAWAVPQITVGYPNITCGSGSTSGGTAILDNFNVPGQLLAPSGIASAEAFGTSIIEHTGGVQFVVATGIASAEAFGTAAVTRGNVNVAPTGIGTAQAFGTPTISVGGVVVGGTGIPSAEAFGAATVGRGAVTIAPTGIPPAETFGTPSVTRKIISLTSTFDTLGEWALYGTASLVGGQAVMPLTNTYEGIYANPVFNLANSSATVKFAQFPNLGNGTTNMIFELYDDRFGPRRSIRCAYEGGALYFQRNTGSGHTIAAWVNYDPALHGWFRIRENNGTTYWETSPDGLSWTTQWSEATPIAVDALGPHLSAGYWGTEPAPGTAIFDHFNIPAQAIVPTGIASAEAFGADTVGRGAVTIAPTGIASAEAFGTATVAGPALVAVSVVGVGNSAGQHAGTTTTAGTASVTPTLPSGSSSGNRIYVFQSHSCATGSAATPANWTAVYKDVLVGTGAPSAGGGQRWISCYYRDYDGLWSMPAFALASAQQNSHSVASIALSKPLNGIWDTPSASGAGEFFGAAGTAFSATSPSFATASASMLLLHTVTNDSVTSTTPDLTGTNGFVDANITERVDGGTTTGNDVSIKVHSADVTTGATGTLTFTQTLSAASQGGFAVVKQTAHAAPSFPVTDTFTDADGVLLNNHVSDSGHMWQAGGLVGQFTIQSNRVWPNDAGFMVAGVTPPSADYEAEVDLYFTGTYVSLQQSAVAVRASATANTLYVAGVHFSSGNFTFNVRRWVAGGFTDMSSVAPMSPAPATGETHTVKLRIEGDQLTAYWDGAVMIGPLTTTAITSVGAPGMYSRDPVTSTTGIHITRFEARNLS